MASANFLKRKLETLFLHHKSKIEDSRQFFPDDDIRHESEMVIIHVPWYGVLGSGQPSIFYRF